MKDSNPTKLQCSDNKLKDAKSKYEIKKTKAESFSNHKNQHLTHPSHSLLAWDPLPQPYQQPSSHSQSMWKDRHQHLPYPKFHVSK